MGVVDGGWVYRGTVGQGVVVRHASQVWPRGHTMATCLWRVRNLPVYPPDTHCLYMDCSSRFYPWRQGAGKNAIRVTAVQGLLSRFPHSACGLSRYCKKGVLCIVCDHTFTVLPHECGAICVVVWTFRRLVVAMPEVSVTLMRRGWSACSTAHSCVQWG